MKKKKRSAKNGYILTEILVALIIAGIAFALLLGAISHTARAAYTIDDEIKKTIQERNAFTENRTTVFSSKEE
jgi:type II secretory pathway pseudopilin PulG